MIVLISLLFFSFIAFPMQPVTAILDNQGNNASRFSMTYNSKQLEAKKAKERALHRNKKLLSGAKGLLFTNGCMMLKGNLAKEAMYVSMISTKVMHETTEHELGKHFGWILLSWSSVFFSGTASIFGWLSNHHKQMQQNMGISPDTTHPTSQSTTTPLILLMGSRGMELIGGTVVLFNLFLTL